MSGKRKSLMSAVARALPLSAVALMCAVVVGSARAESVRVESETNLSMESAFTLDFGEFGDIDGLGALRTGFISSTDMELTIDPELGVARFSRYDQDVAPIILPGGFDTGRIRVLLVPGSSSGTFDRRTGVFVTNEDYAIYFEGDLSAFGLESPVVLPSSSTGTVSMENLTIGSVALEWVGESTIGTGEFAIPFNYFCVVNNEFVPKVESLLALELGPEVLNLELREPYATRLFRLTQMARRAMLYNRTRDAENALLRFIDVVESGMRARVIDPTDAADLVADAEFMIGLIVETETPWVTVKGR